MPSELGAGIPFSAARGDALAPASTLLSAVASPLLAFLTTRDAACLRAVCTEARAAVAAHPWADVATHIRSRLEAWRACFPRARAATLHSRITDADFEHLRGIHTLNMSFCNQITDAAFEHLRGIHTLDMTCCRAITDAAFVHMRGIHTLSMRDCTGITNAAFVHLHGIHTLDMALCAQATLTEAALAHLAGIAELKVYGCRPAFVRAAKALGPVSYVFAGEEDDEDRGDEESEGGELEWGASGDEG